MAADYGLADAKKVVDRALIEESAQLEVEGLAEAKLVAQELADFGGRLFPVTESSLTVSSVMSAVFATEDRLRALWLWKGLLELTYSLADSSRGQFWNTSTSQFRLMQVWTFALARDSFHKPTIEFRSPLIARTSDEIELWREMLLNTQTEADIHTPLH